MAETTQPRSGDPSEEPYRGHTTWSRGRLEFLRSFLGDHRSGTLILVAAMVFSLLWANVAGDAYHSFWNTRLEVSLGGHAAGLSTREIVNQGLMSFFLSWVLRQGESGIWATSATAADPCCPYQSGWSG